MELMKRWGWIVIAVGLMTPLISLQAIKSESDTASPSKNSSLNSEVGAVKPSDQSIFKDHYLLSVGITAFCGMAGLSLFFLQRAKNKHLNSTGTPTNFPEAHPQTILKPLHEDTTPKAILELADLYDDLGRDKTIQNDRLKYYRDSLSKAALIVGGELIDLDDWDTSRQRVTALTDDSDSEGEIQLVEKAVVGVGYKGKVIRKQEIKARRKKP